MTELLVSFAYSFLGMMFNAYVKAVLSKREEKFSISKLIEENTPALPFTILGILICNTVFYLTPEMTSFIHDIFGIQVRPEISKPGSSFTFGFLLYATLRNIFKSVK